MKTPIFSGLFFRHSAWYHRSIRRLWPYCVAVVLGIWQPRGAASTPAATPKPIAALRPPRASAGDVTTAVVASAATAARVSPIFRMFLLLPLRRVNPCAARLLLELRPRNFGSMRNFFAFNANPSNCSNYLARSVSLDMYLEQAREQLARRYSTSDRGEAPIRRSAHARNEQPGGGRLTAVRPEDGDAGSRRELPIALEKAASVRRPWFANIRQASS